MARGGLTATHGAASTTQSLQTLAGGAIVVAALYFARDVLIPFALALLLTFLLAPAVLRLRRWGLGRIPAVMTTVVVAFSVIGLLGWVVTGQLLNLAYQLPSYQENISQKLKSFDTPGEGLFERTGRVFSELNRDLSDGVAPAETDGTREPMPVTVQAPPATPLEAIEAFVSPLLAPIATAGVVIVLVIFMLIGREDLRDRFIGLVGTSRLNVTTQALDDAGLRISRYLLMQFLVNVTYGVPIGVGLYLIGVPNALLWAVLATLLRFVPFLGPLIAMALPLLLAFAVDPGWSMLLMTGGLFLVLELISNNVVEPWLYGASTGISSVAIMVATIFWTWLWGPVGLLLSTPLTVCLAVAGRYVPQLSFLSVLLGNEPALKPEARLYQRMLAMDSEEASEVAGELLEKLSLMQVYDEVVIPALSLAESDRHEGLLEEDRKCFIIDNTRELVTELAEMYAARAGVQGPSAEPSPPPAPIVCIPARDESDELGGVMLRELLRATHVHLDLRSVSESLDQQIAYIRGANASFVIVSSVPPSAVRHAVHVCKRLQAELPDVRVIVGLWSIDADAIRLRARLPEPLAEQLFTRLGQAVEWLRATAAPGADAPMTAPPVPANEAARLNALRRTRLLDTPPEEAFDRVTRRLSEIFDAPISLMSLIDEDRQFWKSQHGLPADLAAAGAHTRETSICGHVVAANETVVIEDAWLDPRFAGNPFLREQNIRFYAGAPLKTSDGSAIGSLCIIDHRPRRITDRDRQLLELMADTVMAEVEARALAREHAGWETSARVFDADKARACALQMLSAPPARQVIGRTVLTHRVSAGNGVPATFAVTRERRDGTIALVIGDVGSGSLSGPLMAAAMSAAAGRIAVESVTAGDLLNALSRIVRCPDGGVAVSATAAILLPQASRVEVATAGYCPPILLRPDAAAPLATEVEPPLFTTGEWTYSGGATFTLEPGDRVLFYTNAAIEVTGTGDSLLGIDGLARLAAEHRQDDADALLASLDAALGQHTEARAEGWSLLSVDLATDAGRASAGQSSDTALAMSETLQREGR